MASKTIRQVRSFLGMAETKKLNTAQRKYSITELECLAGVLNDSECILRGWSLRSYRPRYLKMVDGTKRLEWTTGKMEFKITRI